jgi:hypothetical protein
MSMGGSVLKPKRGLVDEPGSYAGKKSPTRILLEGKLPQLKKDYLSGKSTIELTKKYLPDYEGRSSTTLETVIKDMKEGRLPTKITKAELAKRPKILGLNQFENNALKILEDPKLKKEFTDYVNKPEVKINDILDKYKISRPTLHNTGLRELIKKKVQLGRQTVSPEVTKRFNKILKTIKSTSIPLTQLRGDEPVIKKLADKAGMGVKEFLTDVNRLRADPTRLNLSKKDLKILRRFPDPGFSQALLQVKGYSPKTVKAVRAVERAASSVTEAGSQLEHALPKSLIKEFNLPRKYLLTAERTTNFLNQFKKQFDNQLKNAAKKHAAGEISYPEYKKEVARITKIVSDKTGGYKMGYVDFKDGKPFAVTPQETLLKGEGELGKRTKGLKNYFKNAIYHNKLYENYIKNPNDSAFGTLREEIKQGRYNFVKEVEAENTAKAITKFTKPEEFFSLYQKDPDNIFFKALSKAAGIAGGRGKLLLAGGATLPLLTTALAAETGNEIEEDDSMLPEAAIGTAAAAPLATKKGRSIYGKAAKQIARGVGKTLAPLAVPLEAGFVLSDLKSGASTPEALANIFLLGGAVRQKEKKDFISNKYGPEVYAQIQSYKSFGEDGMDMPQELPDQFQAIELEADQFVEDERTRRAEEFARQTEEDRSLSLMPESMTEGLYALGGRVGFAEGPKDPKRRKFIKIMGGLASLPLVGKYFKLAEPLSKAAPVATESVKLGFDKFMVLVNKIKSLGDDVTPQRSTIEREKVTVYQGKDGSEYELIEDLNTGNKRVTKDKPGMATSGDKSYDTIDNRTVMEYTKGETIPGKKKGTKVADQYDEYEEVAGVDGTFDDVDDVRETVVKEIEDELK